MKKNAAAAARRLPMLGHPESTSKNLEKHLACCVLPDAQAGREGKAADRFRRALETVLKRS